MAQDIIVWTRDTPTKLFGDAWAMPAGSVLFLPGNRINYRRRWVHITNDDGASRVYVVKGPKTQGVQPAYVSNPGDFTELMAVVWQRSASGNPNTLRLETSDDIWIKNSTGGLVDSVYILDCCYVL